MKHGSWKEVEFEPWTVCRYGRDNNLGLPSRLLVLGESHYGTKHRRTITQEVVEEVFAEDVDYRYRFFTSLFMALCGVEREPTREALEEFCHAIAFYNFVQELMDAPGVRPSEEQWAGGIAPFFECLKMLRPSHVVACGFGLWDNLPSGDYSRLADETEAHLVERLPPQYQGSARHPHHDWVGRYEYEGGECLVVKIHHPSIAFGADQWHPVLQRFLKL